MQPGSYREGYVLNQDQVEKLWPQIKIAVRSIWGGLSENEIEKTGGDISAIAALVQENFGEESSSIDEKIGQLLNSFDNDTDLGRDPDRSSYHRSPDVQASQ